MKLLLLLSASILAAESGSLVPRIVSDNYARSVQDYPYMVSIASCDTFPNGMCFKCGGSIIAKRVILTAGHCLYDAHNNLITLPRFEITVSSGSLLDAFTTRDQTPTRQVRQVQRFEVHPNYKQSQSSNYDLALLKLDREFVTTGNSPVRTIPLAQGNYNPAGQGTVSGWGTVDVFNTVDTNRLKYAGVNILPSIDCQRYDPSMIRGNVVCGYRFSEGFCAGDSGGPLVQLISGVRKVVGVVSYSLPRPDIDNIERDLCAAEPDYYVSVPHFNTFITSTMNSI